MEAAAGRRAQRRAGYSRVYAAVSFIAMSATFIASITLLALASITRSPDGNNLQTQPGRCHNPSIFVALLTASTVRFGLCIIAKVWVFYRRHMWQVQDADAERRPEDDFELEPYLGVVDEYPGVGDAGSLRSTQSLPLPQASSDCVLHSESVARPASAPGHCRSDSFVSVIASRSSTSHHPVSPLFPRSHSSSHSPSLELPSSPPPPTTLPTCVSSSSGSRFRTGSEVADAPSSKSPVPPAPDEASPTIGLSERESGATAASPSAILATTSTSPRQCDTPTLSTTSVASVASARRPTYLAPQPPSLSLAGSQTSESRYERRRRLCMKWAATADNLAGKIINSMTLVHFAIWVLGSVACFSQVPTLRRENCYRSAPLLWWPLFVTTIIFGWLHAIHYAYIIIGGALLLIIAACYLVLAHIFGWPVRPLLGMVRPRTPQPEKLTEDDLKACPIVAYIPDPSEPLPEPSIYEPSKAESVRESTSQGIASALLKRITGVEGGKSDVASIEDPKHEAQQEQSGEREDGPSDEQRNGGPSREPSSEPSNEPRSELRGEPVPPGEVDPTRLGLPGAVLSAHQITCAICQSSFVPPREVPGREMYVVERLRQLPCKHVFHVECVDNWLMNHSGICPYCSQKVKDLLKAQNVEESTGGGGASPGEDAGRPGMQQRQGEVDV